MSIALVDGNNFFVSCERVFNPKLVGRPVLVLSNNDGCVIARSNETKALGVKMGAPWYKVRALARQHGIVALSSNYELYADMSNRMMTVLGQFSPQREVYSIDECFLDLAGLAHTDLLAYGRQMRQRVRQWVGLPVCVGIAASKTLAKLANHCAKKNMAGEDSVCDFARLSPQELSALFATIDVGEVWGVGRQLREALHRYGIDNVEALRCTDVGRLKRDFSVVLERLIAELNGEACTDVEREVPDKQQISSSRSFGRYVYNIEELKAAVASYIAIAAEKLRAQDSLAAIVQVYIRTNPHQAEQAQYQPSLSVPLSAASSDTRRLTQAALWGLQRIYRPGYAYQKAGVALLDLSAAANSQGQLFAPRSDDPRLMATLDQINAIWGRGTLRSAAEGFNKSWQMKRNMRSPRCTTNWEELLRVG